MEHEVVIQLPAELVQPALADATLLARCVPGLSTDASDAAERRTAAKRSAASGPEEINGRLRVRIGGSTITYRGVVSLIRSGGTGVLTAFAEGQEVRGEGEVVATLRLRVEPPATDGASSTVLRFSGDLTPGGRLAEFDGEALAVAGRRLLDRFAHALTAELKGAPTLTVVPDDRDEDESREEDGDQLPDDLFADDLSDLIAFSPETPAEPDAGNGEAPESEGTSEPVEPAARMDLPYGYPRAVEEPFSPDDPLGGPVRRSIVGRSAEEVDHAPPRGRYAPALPARSARARAASRWYGDQQSTAPVATRLPGRISAPWVIGGGVALLGGAVIVARALRRR
ncbi:carbon monoxide dehydrogenase subunit G [Kitasatospora sp. GAS204A]|uniref:hypothetical protein n=1 Tax=unclassified Kitasatospora TaxID=2633591 RepID=UPI002475DA6D|nr:hypothetical protein [Kitasatospora sp. GAS204B]MDH6120078.1 carbon monoxide dehydrogenase subunit G [Kitasatospora sp. GAS204B]